MNRHKRNIFILVCLFVVSRVLMYMVRPFYFDPINFYMQYLDPEVLKHDLLNGLWHLHSQPPLFNAFLGLLLKFSPAGMAPVICQGIYSLMTLGIVLGVYAILRFKNVPSWLCFWAACLVMLFPSIIKSETWLFYTCPVVFLVVMSTVCLMRFEVNGSRSSFSLFVLLLTILVLTRSFFHLILWMVPAVLLCAGYAIYRNKSIAVFAIVVSVIGLSLAGTVYLKNYVQYGMFTASTWQGMNVAAMTAFVDDSEIKELEESGTVTALAGIPRFSYPEAYFKYYGSKPNMGIKVLDAKTKSTGEGNWNNEIYVRASKEYQKNTFNIIRKYPLKYMKAVLNAAYIFFGFSPYMYFHDFNKWGGIRGVSMGVAVRRVIYLYLTPFVLFSMFIAGFWGLYGKLTCRIDTDRAGRRKWCPVMVYILFNVVYIFVVANALELGEGCFMRVPMDPLLIIGCALLIGKGKGNV